MPARTATKAEPTVPTAEVEPQIILKRIEQREVRIEIVGVTPLIVHRFSEKAKQQMLDKQQGRAATKKAPKDPEADYQGAFYRMPNGAYGFPATGFKAATIGGARYFDGVAMTQLRRALGFIGEGPDQLVEIKGEPKMREDVVRISAGSTDLRYRPQFDEWSATLRILYVPSLLTAESLVALVQAGGMGGVGEWRPGKCDSGTYGTYDVVGDAVAVTGE